MRSATFFILIAAGVVSFAHAATAQEKGTRVAGCEPGFEKRPYPHGSEHNFRCRSRVIDCPDRQGHHVTVVLEQTLDLAAGAQFGYRCEYRSQDR